MTEKKMGELLFSQMSTIYMHCYTIGKIFLKELSENIPDRRKEDCQSIDRYVVLVRSSRGGERKGGGKSGLQSLERWGAGLLVSADPVLGCWKTPGRALPRVELP